MKTYNRSHERFKKCNVYLQTTKELVLKEVFPSDAMRLLQLPSSVSGNISKVLKGQMHSVKGYTFEYA